MVKYQCSYIFLVARYPAKVSNEYRTDDKNKQKTIVAANSVAENYVDKNLAGGHGGLMIDAWTKTIFQSEQGLYEKDDNLYFVVKLQEEIRHFFLPGWFDDMNAPVTAIALMSKTVVESKNTSLDPFAKYNDGREPPFMPEMPGMPQLIEKFTDADLEILEDIRNKNVLVANWQIQDYYREKLIEYNGKVADDNYYKHMLSVNGIIPQVDLYTRNWNQFQDKNNHYESTNTYRKETINVWDDDIKNTFDSDGKITGVELNETNRSSVKNPNNASKNDLNPKGLPFMQELLDSIDLDVVPDVSFNEVHETEDWDLVDGYNGAKILAMNGNSSNGNSPARELLRIHTSINFGAPYKVRPDKEEPDVLWARIESEAMYPVQYKLGKLKDASNEGLNSVRQWIINVNQSNFGNDCRPLVIFYDGPEKLSTSGKRDSLPVIVNINADCRFILYAPNSAVVFNNPGNHKFHGFIVAKNYLRLKTEDDFEEKPEKYTRSAEGGFEERNPSYNPYTKGQINQKYFRSKEYPNIWIDLYGNVQYEELTRDEFRGINRGTYETFKITDFSSHDYTLETSPDGILLYSGK